MQLEKPSKSVAIEYGTSSAQHWTFVQARQAESPSPASQTQGAAQPSSWQSPRAS
jgi:hypothetical protein